MINKTFYTKNDNFGIEDVNELGFAVRQGNYTKTLSILKNGIDVNRLPSIIEVYNSVEELWTKQDNKNNKTILILALECRYDKIKFREKIVTLLIEHGADISASDTQNDTPLHYATRNSMTWHKSHLPFRIPSSKAHISLLENNFYHPYYWDSIDNCVEIILKAGADPNIKNKYGNTPLHYGCSQGMLTSDIKKLIEHGANIHEKNNLGATPLHVCFSSWYGQRYSMHYPVQDVNYHPSLERAHINFWKSAATTLIAFGANINEQDNDGYTPLFHWLCTHSSFCKISSAGYSLTKRGIQFFLENKADITISNNRQNTPLHYACWACHTDAVKMLVKAGANVNSLTSNHKTPLDLALDDSYPWSPHSAFGLCGRKKTTEKKRVEKILRKAGAKRNDELRQEKSVLSNKQQEQKHSFSVAVLNILIIIVIAGTILKSCYS